MCTFVSVLLQIDVAFLFESDTCLLLHFFFTVAEVQFDPVQYRVSEGAGNAVLELVSSRTCQFDYNVIVDVFNGTATG